METKISPNETLTMKRKSFAFLLLGFGVLLGGAAIAGRPTLPVLNPPPPPYETCKATGSGAICTGNRVDSISDAPLGIVCGTAENPVELVFSGTDSFRFTRYYDRAGNFTRRVTHEDFQGFVINPVTGLSANLTQVSNFIDTFAVPGDTTTSTEQMTGVIKFSLPGSGVLFLDAGRIVFDSQDNIVSASGRHDLFVTYFNGNTAVAAQLCDAVGSPGTP